MRPCLRLWIKLITMPKEATMTALAPIIRAIVDRFAVSPPPKHRESGDRKHPSASDSVGNPESVASANLLFSCKPQENQPSGSGLRRSLIAAVGRRGLLQGRLLARMTMGSGALVHGIGGGKQSVWICKTPLHQIRVWPDDGCNMITLITICYFGLVAVVKARAVESRGPRASGLLHRQTPVFRGRIRGTVMRPSGHCFFCLLSLAVPSESCILQQLAHLVGPTNLALATRCGMNRSALTASSRGADICP